MKRRSLVMATGVAALVPTLHVRAQAAEIVLGNTGILTGPLGGPVKTMLAGANLAFNDINGQGGIAGRKIRVVSLDDELKPDKAVANYQKLLTEHKAFAFFSCVGSGTTAAASKLLKDSGSAMVGGFAVSDSARDKTTGSAFYVRATTGREAEAIVQQLTTIGISRIAVAHLDNPGGTEALKLVDTALATYKLKALAAAGVKGDASNAAAVAKTLAAVDPQAVIMYLGGPLGGEVMKAMWALGSHPSFYGMSIVPGELIAKVIGERARGLAIAQIVPYPWNEVDNVIKEYRSLATEAKVPVGYYSFEGYANALVMIDVLKRVGGDLNRTRLLNTLRATKMRIAGMAVDFTTGNHTGSRFVELVQVTHQGRFVR